VGVEVIVDGGDEVGADPKTPAADCLVGEITEPAYLTRLSHELEVGVKCRWNRGFFSSPR